MLKSTFHMHDYTVHDEQHNSRQFKKKKKKKN